MDDSTTTPTSQPQAAPSQGADDSLRPAVARPPRRPRREHPSTTPPALPTVSEHPLTRRHYRVATAAIEAFVNLVEMCVRLLIPGALIHARPRMGKTHAIDCVVLHAHAPPSCPAQSKSRWTISRAPWSQFCSGASIATA